MSNYEELSKALSARGYNEGAIGGILANVHSESGGDPQTNEGHVNGDQWTEDYSNTAGWGLAQWTGPRKQAFKEYADAKGVSYGDMQAQVEFLDSELQQMGLKDTLNSQDAATATRTFMTQFERPADQSEAAQQGRIANLQIVGQANTAGLGGGMVVGSAVEQAPETFTYESPEARPSVAPSWGTEFTTALSDEVHNSWWWNLGRLGADRLQSGNAFGNASDYKWSEEDNKYLEDRLKNDADGQKWVRDHAVSQREMQLLVDQRSEDNARRQQLQAYMQNNQASLNDPDSWKNLITNGAYLGGLAGSFIDPVILAGGAIGGAAKAVRALKVMERLGMSAYDTSAIENVISRAGKFVGVPEKVPVPVTRALQGARNFAGYNTADIYLNSLTTADGVNGYSAKDYAYNAAAGALTGALLHSIGGYLKDNFKGDSELGKLATQVAGEHNQTIQYAADMRKLIATETKDVAKGYHDASAYGGSLNPNKAMALSFDDAKKVLAEVGRDLPEGTTSVHFPNEGYSWIIKDNVPDADITKHLTQSGLIHGDYESLMGPTKYNELMSKVADEANKKGTDLATARIRVGSNDPQQILSYAMTNGLLKGKMAGVMVNRINSNLRKQGVDLSINKTTLKEMATNKVETSMSYDPAVPVVNPDGSTAFGGMKLSSYNPMNPESFKDIVESLDPTVDTAKIKWWDSSPNIVKKALKWNEKNTYIGSGYGICINSDSPSIRKATMRLFSDPAQRGMHQGIEWTAADNKARMVNSLQPYIRQVHDLLDDYVSNKRNILQKTVGVMGVSDKYAVYKNACSDVIDYINEKYGKGTFLLKGDVDPQIAKIGDIIHHGFKPAQLELAKTSASSVGIKDASRNLIDADFSTPDNEFYRHFTKQSQLNLLSNFKNKAEALEWLNKYCLDAAQSKAEITREKMLNAIKRQNKDLKERGLEPKPEVVSDEDLQKKLEEDAHGTATRWLDTGDVNLTMPDGVSGMGNTTDVGTLGTMLERHAMDTRMTKELPNGKNWSFDEDMRDVDILKILNAQANRSAGEGALKAHFKDPNELRMLRDKVTEELKSKVKKGEVSSDSATRQLDEFSYQLNNLRGLPTRVTPLKNYEKALRIFQNLALANDGSGFGFASLMDVGPLMAEAGIKHMIYQTPGLGKLLDGIKGGVYHSNELERTSKAFSGENMQDIMRTFETTDRTLESQVGNDIAGRLVGGVGNITKAIGQTIGDISMVNKIDAVQRQIAARGAVMDIMAMANGEPVGKVFGILRARNPYSKAILEGAGFKDYEEFHNALGLIKKHGETNSSGYQVGFDTNKIQAENPVAYAKLFRLIKNQVGRAKVDARTPEMTNYQMQDNIWWKLFGMLKTTTNAMRFSQAQRMITQGGLNAGIGTALALVSSYLARQAQIGIQYQVVKNTQGQTAADQYWDGKQKNAMMNAIWNTPVMAPMSLARDMVGPAANALTGTEIAETGSRYQQHAVKLSMGGNAGGMAGQLAGQYSPAVGAVTDLANSVHAMGLLAAGRGNQRDFRDAVGILPFEHIPAVGSMVAAYGEKHFPLKHDNRPK